ncbi:DUF6766 family protein [Mesorhizobium sp. RIZ17]|uniref:DUF6766 family protein n=1 Tax=Mesorhizobium sp. RIZ17 TaxID=3132743 RepID=UPI003DA9B731
MGTNVAGMGRRIAASPEDEDPTLRQDDPQAPWPVKRGGWVARLYSRSLGAALLAIFMVTFIARLWQSTRHAAEQAAAHGQPAEGVLQHLFSGQILVRKFPELAK